MDIASQILVVILSVFLAIFLVLAIILTAYLIALTKQIRRITDSAEKTVGNFGSFISGALKVLSPMFIADVISGIFKKAKKANSENKNNKQEEDE